MHFLRETVDFEFRCYFLGREGIKEKILIQLGWKIITSWREERIVIFNLIKAKNQPLKKFLPQKILDTIFDYSIIYI